MTGNNRPPVWTNSQIPLRAWYASGLGQSILVELDTHLDVILPRIFGYQGLQIGNLSDNCQLLQKAGIHRSVMLDCPGIPSDISADALSLPIASDIMKLVVLPHTLDFCNHPHQVLREADRVLTDDGQIVIIGFNPYSLFGVVHQLLGWRGNAPWNGQFFSRRRITEWLSVLNYQVLNSSCLFVRPPLRSSIIQSRLARLERLQPWIGGIGGVYVLHARKQTIPMTLARRQRRLQRTGIAVGSFAKAANRNAAKNNLRQIQKIE